MARTSMKAAKAAVACELEEIRAAVRGEPPQAPLRWSIFFPAFRAFDPLSGWTRDGSPHGVTVKKGVKPKPKRKAPARRRK